MPNLFNYAAALLELADDLSALELAEGLFVLARHLGEVGGPELEEWRQAYDPKLRSLLPSGDCFLDDAAADSDTFEEGRPARARLEAEHADLFAFVRTRLFFRHASPQEAAGARLELLTLVEPLTGPGADDTARLVGKALLVVYCVQLRFGGAWSGGDRELCLFQKVFNRRDEFTFPITTAADRLVVRAMQNVMFASQLGAPPEGAHAAA